LAAIVGTPTFVIVVVKTALPTSEINPFET
jgi:hypothetical protein